MKKLNKLQINSEKLMKSEDLMTLRGGEACTCCCGDAENECCYGYLVSESGQCQVDCQYVFGIQANGTCGNCSPSCPICGGY
jgi:hypothetical protein